MSELARPIGIGFAARGKVSEVVGWADDARRQGVHSVWIHDSLYERDAVTYATAIAVQVPQIRVSLGALSVYTRSPALIAMTVSALDEIAPGRIILGLGTSIPLRLAQMGIPYSPEAGVENVSKAIDTLKAMWTGQRIPSATPNLPPIQPMFPPVHRVPIYIAAYRTPFLQLAGEKADGYLARPAESIPNMKRLIAKLRSAAVGAGRDENAVDVAGYLLTHVDKSRREAMNRAKREPFVIYMISVLSNFSLEQAGFEPALRDQIAAAWRAEDYHKAAQLIPDEVLDSFMLCGTPDEVAEGAARYNEAGMTTPILQPIIQEDDQIQKILHAAQLYGSAAIKETSRPAVETLFQSTSGTGKEKDRLNVFERTWRKFGAAVEITRPFSFTASAIPVLAAGAIALVEKQFNFPLFLISLAASVLLHIGTNITNEIYDVRNGVDSITSPRASLSLLKGRLTEKEAFTLTFTAFTLAMLFGIALIAARGWPVALLGFLGLALGFGYTAPPFQYKYRAMGLPLVFILMGPLMVMGAYYVITGSISISPAVVSIPIGFLVTAILHGNEWRDISDDARFGIGTFSGFVGRKWAHLVYVSLVSGAFLAVVLGVLLHWLPQTSLLALLSLPLLMRAVHTAGMGVNGLQRSIAKIDLETAQLHAAFGILFVVGLALGKV
ncbi:MAG: LLM class flavin-dependent oxidoreductase [Chloroflexi bacterium]|nr:LLM class flavin-dependent oxidoreductase [Chloroflexota bacterium]